MFVDYTKSCFSVIRNYYNSFTTITHIIFRRIRTSLGWLILGYSLVQECKMKDITVLRIQDHILVSWECSTTKSYSFKILKI